MSGRRLRSDSAHVGSSCQTGLESRPMAKQMLIQAIAKAHASIVKGFNIKYTTPSSRARQQTARSTPSVKVEGSRCHHKKSSHLASMSSTLNLSSSNFPN